MSKIKKDLPFRAEIDDKKLHLLVKYGIMYDVIIVKQ